MISKELFVESVKYVEDFDQLMRNAEDVLGISVDFDGPMYEGIEQVIKLLHVTMEDEDDWLEYFMYECDFGRSWEDGDVEIGGEPIAGIHDAAALYDFMLQYYSEMPESVERAMN